MGIFKRLHIHWTLPILFIFALAFGFINQLIAVYLIVLLHECGHMLAASRFNVPIERITFSPLGVNILLKSYYIKVPKQEIIVALAGPVANILLALVAIALYANGKVESQISDFLITANVIMAVVNLVPALPLDGGRACKAMLTIRWGFIKAFNFTIVLTKIFAIVLSIGGLAILVVSGFNFSLLLIGAFLLANVISEHRVGSQIIMRDIIYSREKLSDGALTVKLLAVRRDELARKLIKSFSYNNYYMFNIIDEDMKVIGTLTETQIIDGIVKKGSRIKAYEI